MKRNITGALLCLLFVGEINVAFHNGLFTPVGFFVLLFLYIFYFQLLDALIDHYKLSNASGILINFSLYSVLITGLFHGEIADYVLHPKDDIITTLIRIQCSLFPIFVYQLLRRWKVSQKGKAIGLSRSALYFVCYIVLVSLTKTFGLQKLYSTFVTAPGYAWVFVALAAVSAVAAGLRVSGVRKQFELPNTVLYVLLAISIVPFLPAFFILMFLELILAGYYLSNGRFRSAPIK